MILYFEALSQQPQMRLQSHNLHVVLDTLVHRYLFALEDTTIQCHSSSFVNRFEGTLNWNPDLTLPIFLVPKRVPMNNFRTRQQLRDVGPFSVTAGTRFEVAMLQSYTYIYIYDVVQLCSQIVGMMFSSCWWSSAISQTNMVTEHLVISLLKKNLAPAMLGTGRDSFESGVYRIPQKSTK